MPKLKEIKKQPGKDSRSDLRKDHDKAFVKKVIALAEVREALSYEDMAALAMERVEEVFTLEKRLKGVRKK